MLIILLPASVIMAASGFSHRTDAIREAETKTLLLVQSLAAQQEQIAAGTKQMLSTLAQLPQVKNVDASACNEIFDELKKKNPSYSFIGASKPDGSVFAGIPFRSGTNLSDRKHIKDAIRTLDFSVGEYIVGRVSNVTSINFTYPVLDANKQLVAILIAAIRLDDYAHFLTKVNLPRESAFAICDHKGIRLFSFPETDAARPGIPISNEAFQVMSGDQDQGTFERVAQDGIYRIYAFKRLKLREDSSPYLYISVGIAKDGIVKEANLDLLRDLSWLLLLGLISMILAWMSAKHLLIQPINQLVETAHYFGKGELGTRTRLPHTPDELGQLARSFDEMASLLEIRSNERMRAEAALHSAYGELDVKVALRTAELAEVNESLQTEVLERRKAEGALRAALTQAENEKSRAESIILGMSDGLAIIDRDFKIVYENEISRTNIGNHVGELCYRAVYGRDDVCEGCAVIRCFSDGRVYKKESSRIIDGKSVHFEITASPLRNSTGEITGAIEISRDITERKKAEDAIVESRQQLLDIINFLPDATFVIDTEGKVIAWNRAMEELAGVGAEAMLGKDCYEYALPFHGERRPMLIDFVFGSLEEAETKYPNVKRQGRVLKAQGVVPSGSGGERHLLGAASALYDSRGNVVGAIESIRDITEQKLMEEAIALAEEKYRDIFENSVTGIFQVSPEGRFLSINKAVADVLGYDSPEAALKEVSDVTQLYVNPQRRSDLYRLIEKHGSVRDFEAEFFKNDKSIVWVSLNVRAVRDRTGKIAYLEGTAQDITDSKNLKAQLNQAHKMEAIGTLAGGIAHDFNNILTPIIGYTELSLNVIPEDGRLHHNMMQVLLSAKRAKDLVKQILTFSRRTELEPKPVQVSLLIKEALNLLRSSLPATIEIRRKLDEDAIHSTITADPTQIHQVLMNLCTNAAHAMREKGGVLSVALENVDIVSGAERGFPDMEPGPYLKLSVTDTGHGMDEAVRRRIFDPYFTTKGQDEGTGMGMAVVYGIVKSLSGQIAVFTKPGDGSAFDLYFPRTKTIQVPQEEVSAPLPKGRGRILLVDDEKFIVDMIREMLHYLGYEVVPRYASPDALETFKTRPESFDLVVTDLTMPLMTGVALAREILVIRPDTPIILCTGFSEALDESKTMLLGIKRFLRKPVAMRDLAEAVSEMLN